MLGTRPKTADVPQRIPPAPNPYTPPIEALTGGNRADTLYGQLDALNPMSKPIGPQFPPAAVVGRFDPELASLIAAVPKAEARAKETADAWLATQPGGADFAAAVAEEGRLISSGTVVLPGNSPLQRLLAQGQWSAYAEAMRAQLKVAIADQRARTYAAGNKTLYAALEKAAADIGEEMAGYLAQVKSKQDLVRWLEAKECRVPYAELDRLKGWAKNPTETYQNSPWGITPPSLRVAYFNAGNLVGEPVDPPDELLPERGSDRDPTWTGVRPR